MTEPDLLEMARTLRNQPRPTNRLKLSLDEASSALGVSRDFFDDRILPELQVERRGRLVLVPLCELEAWIERARDGA